MSNILPESIEDLISSYLSPLLFLKELQEVKRKVTYEFLLTYTIDGISILLSKNQKCNMILEEDPNWFKIGYKKDEDVKFIGRRVNCQIFEFCEDCKKKGADTFCPCEGSEWSNFNH